MKKILIFSILFSAITLPSLGELSDDDLNRIRLIVKEEVNAEIESFEKDIKEWLMSRLNAEGKFNPCSYWLR